MAIPLLSPGVNAVRAVAGEMFKITRTSGNRGHRQSEIDLVKALAIVTVVLVHCINDRPFYSGDRLQAFLSDWTRFAVPWFLFAAGFLFPKDDSSGWRLLGKLAARIVPPYMVCSLLCIALSVFSGQESYGAWRVLKELLLGQACGIYYFVFVISYLYLLGLVLRRAPPHIVYAACGLAFGALLAIYATWPALIYPRASLNVALRHPFIHAFPFLAGWVAALHQFKLRELLRQLRARDVFLLAAMDLATLGALQWWPSGDMHRELLIQAHVYVFLILVLHLGLRINRPWEGIRYLSEASYGIYLVHMGFVVVMHKLFRQLGVYDFDVRIFVSCGLAFGLTVVLITAIRCCTGSRSKLLVGA